MTDTTRRDFLRNTGLAAGVVAGAAALTRNPVARAAEGEAVPAAAGAAPTVPASEKIVLGFVGPGGQGTNLLNSFLTMPEVAVAYVCDVDERRISDAMTAVEESGRPLPKGTKDMREVYDTKDVDAVVIATPDHWHAPATILACDAGKHVYVEKPASHNIREGRLMVDAARRNKRVVQLGTQSRSVEHNVKIAQMLKEGVIGDVLCAKAWNSQRRGDIGKQQPSDPPAWIDYEGWLGPAPFVPYRSNMLPGSWRWFYAFGTGDIGNDGVHDIDVARWGLGVTTHPDRVVAGGGKYFLGDNDQEFPDTQYVTYEYAPSDATGGKRRLFIYEQRLWSPYHQEANENGCAWYGTQGMVVGGKKSGWQIIGPGNEVRERVVSDWVDAPHHRNFLECVKSGQTPNADIEVGHLSSVLSHLGNIATRVGHVIHFDPKTEEVIGDDEAAKLVRREYRDHWAVPKNV